MDALPGLRLDLSGRLWSELGAALAAHIAHREPLFNTANSPERPNVWDLDTLMDFVTSMNYTVQSQFTNDLLYSRHISEILVMLGSNRPLCLQFLVHLRTLTILTCSDNVLQNLTVSDTILNSANLEALLPNRRLPSEH